jgi:hypothetical protein
MMNGPTTSQTAPTLTAEQQNALKEAIYLLDKAKMSHTADQLTAIALGGYFIEEGSAGALIKAIQRQKEDVSRGDAVFRCGFNANLVAAVQEIRALFAASSATDSDVRTSAERRKSLHGEP